MTMISTFLSFLAGGLPKILEIFFNCKVLARILNCVV